MYSDTEYLWNAIILQVCTHSAMPQAYTWHSIQLSRTAWWFSGPAHGIVMLHIAWLCAFVCACVIVCFDASSDACRCVCEREFTYARVVSLAFVFSNTIDQLRKLIYAQSLCVYAQRVSSSWNYHKWTIKQMLVWLMESIISPQPSCPRRTEMTWQVLCADKPTNEWTVKLDYLPKLEAIVFCDGILLLNAWQLLLLS